MGINRYEIEEYAGTIKAVPIQTIETIGVVHALRDIYLIKFSETSSFTRRRPFDAYCQLMRKVILMRNIFKWKGY